MEEKELKKILDDNSFSNESVVFSNVNPSYLNDIYEYIARKENNVFLDMDVLSIYFHNIGLITKDIADDLQKDYIIDKFIEVLSLTIIFVNINKLYKIPLNEKDLLNVPKVFKSKNYLEFLKELNNISSNFNFELLKEVCINNGITINIFIDKYNYNDKFNKIINYLLANFKTKVYEIEDIFKNKGNYNYDFLDNNMIL